MADAPKPAQQPKYKNKPSGSAFRQQNLPAWTPVMTPVKFIITLVSIGVVFLAIGIPAYICSAVLPEYIARYDLTCPIGAQSLCAVNLVVTQDLEPPVFFYYHLENFYQNHRRYVKSRSDAQLAGDNPDHSTLADCDPLRYWNDTNKTQASVINPCGLIAFSKFSDVFLLQDSNGTVIPWTSNGIAWDSDVKNKFKYNPNQYLNVTDPDFIVWMRTAALPNFRKLYRIIYQKIPKGTYTIMVNSTFNVTGFGEKRVILTKTTWIGGKNDFIGIAYIIVGAICLALAGIFATKQLCCPRPLGNLDTLLGAGTEASTNDETSPPKVTEITPSPLANPIATAPSTTTTTTDSTKH